MVVGYLVVVEEVGTAICGCLCSCLVFGVFVSVSFPQQLFVGGLLDL